MNTDRLYRLITVAKYIPMDKLDMGTWGGCGTHACLAGWACRNPLLNGEGLAMVKFDNTVVPGFEGSVGFQALDKFFGLHGFETTHLFSPIAYSGKPTREELLQHVNDILAGNFAAEFGTTPKYITERAA